MTGHRDLPADVEAYSSLIAEFQGLGYRARGFQKVTAEAPDLILRHDLDVSIIEAVPMAEIEHRLGVAATYFVRMDCDLYNPATPANRAALDRITRCGHEIGLHFDAAADDHLGAAEMEEAADRTCESLERLTLAPVRIISFHKPADHLLGRSETFAGRRHAYEPAFFDDIGYCSDSQGAWRHGHPLDRPEVVQRRALQLLTHPVWWLGLGKTPQEALDATLERRSTATAAEIAAVCSNYAAPEIKLDRP